MGLRNRIRRLEARLETNPERCPECNGKIVIEEHREDGTVTYPSGLPCSACDNIPPDGGIGKIVVLFLGRLRVARYHGELDLWRADLDARKHRRGDSFRCWYPNLRALVKAYRPRSIGAVVLSDYLMLWGLETTLYGAMKLV